MIFFGSDRSATADVVGPADMSDEAANFSAGSFTVAETYHNVAIQLFRPCLEYVYNDKSQNIKPVIR